MGPQKQHSDAVHWFMNDLGSRVVAKSGIASDKFHIGKLTLQSFKDAPDHILQIDGATGESQTFRSALERSVRCATAFRALGLKTNDVIVVSGPNHIDLTTPIYAAFYLGINVACMDPTLGLKEQQDTFQICLPKLILCQSDKEKEAKQAAKNLNLDVIIVTFDKGTNNCNFSDFLEKYGDNTPVEKFEPANFDTDDTIALLISTSGTTGVPKCAALTHKNLMMGWPTMWVTRWKFPTPVENALVLSPIQWVSATSSFVMSPLLRFTRIQSSLPATTEHLYFLINRYKPSYMMVSPNTMTSLLKPGDREQCDFSCFKIILLAGSAVPKTLLETVQRVIPKVSALIGYGMTEVATVVLNPVYSTADSCGVTLGSFQYRLVDPATGKDIVEFNKPGELWIKGPTTFKGYYNNPKATAEMYVEDKWVKSGDIFYVDENGKYYFVDRLKLLLKYRNHQISPIEIESTIRKHPGVLDVAVTGIADYECGELPVACIVPHENYRMTAQEIKDLVKESLSDSKQLRGGVIFMKELPLTSSSKKNGLSEAT
ncbi:unnamed protein product, partial [Iphiclides podalirius]